MLNMIAREKAAQEDRFAVGEFSRLARLLMETKGAPSEATARAANVSDRILQIVAKAEPGMISAPGGSPETWGGEYLAYSALSSAFLASLSNSNVFDAALPFMRRAPLKSRVPSSSVAATAYVVGESDVKTPS